MDWVECQSSLTNDESNCFKRSRVDRSAHTHPPLGNLYNVCHLL